MLFLLSHFSVVAMDSHGTIHLVFGLVGIHLAVASVWAVTKFSSSLFRVYLSDVS